MVRRVVGRCAQDVAELGCSKVRAKMRVGLPVASGYPTQPSRHCGAVHMYVDQSTFASKQTRSGTRGAMPSLQAAEPPCVHQPLPGFLSWILVLSPLWQRCCILSIRPECRVDGMAIPLCLTPAPAPLAPVNPTHSHHRIIAGCEAEACALRPPVDSKAHLHTCTPAELDTGPKQPA